MRTARVAALCCAVMAGSAATPAHAQYYGGPPPMYYRPPPPPSLWQRLFVNGFQNVVGGFGNAYGYHGGPPPGYCPPVRPQLIRHRNPAYHGGGYRCWTETGQPAPPNGGDGFCVRH